MTNSVEDVQELVSMTDLAGIRTYEVRGVRVDRSDPVTGLALQVQFESREDRFEVRFRADVQSVEADYVIDLGLQYTVTQKVEMTDDVRSAFIEKVAVMSAYPFIREAIATTGARLGVPVPMLGLLRAGDVILSEEAPN